MRRSAVVMLIAGSIASVLGAVAHAGEKAGTPALSARPSPEVLARFDTNRDGTLDVAERAAMKQSILQRMQPARDARFKQYDLNKNGLLDDDERQVMQQDRRMLHERVEKWALERYDANRNGVLDPAEQQARKAAREEWVSQKKSQILETFDANKNGTLDPAERAVIHQKTDAARQAALDMYDSNRDGRLDEAERAVATGADVAQRRGTQAPGTAGKARPAEGTGTAKPGETAVAAGPPLSNLRISPMGGGSYAQGAEIAFTLGRPAAVTVRIYDAAGRLVRTLASGLSTEAGAQVLRWDGTGSSGRAVSNGLYFVKVEVPGGAATRKVAYIR